MIRYLDPWGNRHHIYIYIYIIENIAFHISPYIYIYTLSYKGLSTIIIIYSPKQCNYYNLQNYYHKPEYPTIGSFGP